MKTQRVKAGAKSTRLTDRYWCIYRNPNETTDIEMFGAGFLFPPADIKDRRDWIKLGGYYFDIYRPHGRTVMVAFRSRPDLHATEYTFYYHNIKDTEGYKTVGSVPGYVNDRNTLIVPWKSEINPYTFIQLYISVKDSEVSLVLQSDDGGAILDKVEFNGLLKTFTRGNVHYGKGREPKYDVIVTKKIKKKHKKWTLDYQTL
jgi:hypothetical protein